MNILTNHREHSFFNTWTYLFFKPMNIFINHHVHMFEPIVHFSEPHKQFRIHGIYFKTKINPLNSKKRTSWICLKLWFFMQHFFNNFLKTHEHFLQQCSFYKYKNIKERNKQKRKKPRKCVDYINYKINFEGKKYGKIETKTKKWKEGEKTA